MNFIDGFSERRAFRKYMIDPICSSSPLDYQESHNCLDMHEPVYSSFIHVMTFTRRRGDRTKPQGVGIREGKAALTPHLPGIQAPPAIWDRGNTQGRKKGLLTERHDPGKEEHL
jgi:hypothetical protein